MSNDIEREAFEREFPVPNGVAWIDDRQGYRITSDDDYWWDTEGQKEFHGYLCKWYAWKAAKAQPEQPSAGVVPEAIKAIANKLEQVEGKSAEGGYMWDARECADFIREEADKIAAAPTAPVKSKPLPVNRYGVDRDYFTKKLEILIRDMRDYTPAELARSLGRLAMTADSETMREPEFNAAPAVQGGGVPDDWFHCPACGTHEVEINQICNNSDCREYAEDRTLYVGWRDTHPHNGEQGDKRCSWWKDMADWDGNTWESDCGACWTFIDDGPAQNEMHFCPKCGRKLSQLPAAQVEGG